MTDEPAKDTPDQPTQGASQPTPPPPPGPAYQHDYSRLPQSRGGGPSVLLLGGLALALVLVVGAGAMFALGLGPFARATPTPTRVAQPSPTIPLQTPFTGPSASPTHASTPAATATASAGSTATPIPSGDINDLLLSHIPSAIAPTCTVTERNGAIVVIATCSADDGDITLTYFHYDSHESMFTAYEGFRLASQIGPGQGDCADPASWPTENPYDISGQPAGRWLCTEALGETSIYWTDDRLNILSHAVHTKADYARLVNFWVSESGPNL